MTTVKYIKNTLYCSGAILAFMTLAQGDLTAQQSYNNIQSIYNDIPLNSSNDLRKHFEDIDDRQSSGGSITLSVPTGFGSEAGNVFAGFGTVSRVRNDTYYDGAFNVGAGFGNAKKYLGGSVSLSLYDAFGTPTQTGGVNAQLWKDLGKGAALSVGGNDLLSWGLNGFRLSTLYLAGTKVFKLNNNGKYFRYISTNAGVGNGTFNSETQIQTNLVNNTNRGIGVFGGVAINVNRPLNIIANFNGQDLDAGVSIAPLKFQQLNINIGGLDLLGLAGDGIRMSASVGYNYKFK